MSVYIEVELRCDGVENDRFGCSAVYFANTGTKARAIARERGWLIGQPGGKDFCPEHRAEKGAA